MGRAMRELYGQLVPDGDDRGADMPAAAAPDFRRPRDEAVPDAETRTPRALDYRRRVEADYTSYHGSTAAVLLASSRLARPWLAITAAPILPTRHGPRVRPLTGHTSSSRRGNLSPRQASRGQLRPPSRERPGQGQAALPRVMYGAGALSNRVRDLGVSA
jgi:hypothetical protein